jgi:tRNA threonylcarbamoyladenosine modification (KEOPS) complex  Pcc1 subunit
LRNAKAEAEVSIDFLNESDAEAIERALVPEIVAPRTSRAFIRVTRQGKVTKMAFYAGDLIALRAMVNSFLRFAAPWRKLCEALSISHRHARRVRRSTTGKRGESVV